MNLMAAGVFVLQKRDFSLAVASCASLLLHALLAVELLSIYSPANNGAASTPARLQIFVVAPLVVPQARSIPTTQREQPAKEQNPQRIPENRKTDSVPSQNLSPPTAAPAPVAEIAEDKAFALP